MKLTSPPGAHQKYIYMQNDTHWKLSEKWHPFFFFILKMVSFFFSPKNGIHFFPCTSKAVRWNPVGREEKQSDQDLCPMRRHGRRRESSLRDEQFKSHFGYTSPQVQKQEDKSPKLVRKPVRLIDSNHEDRCNICLLLKQGRESQLKLHWTLACFP